MSGGEFKAENMAVGKKSSIFGAKKQWMIQTME
jgi:hypothetical protein